MNHEDFMAQYPDEASAERYFIAKRWPNGVKCTRCGGSDVRRNNWPGRKRQLWSCGDKTCCKQFSITSETVMDCSKLTMRQWLMAMYLLLVDNINIRRMSVAIGINYGAALHLEKRIRAIADIRHSGIESLDAAASNMEGARLTLYASSDAAIPSVHSHKDNESVIRLRRVAVLGADLTIAELADLSRRHPQSIMARMRGGKSAEEAAFGAQIATPKPVGRLRYNSISGATIREAFETHGTVARTAAALGISHGTCWSRCNGLGLIKPRKNAPRKQQ